MTQLLVETALMTVGTLPDVGRKDRREWSLDTVCI